MDRELKRKLAAILVADVVGYSRLIADDEEATLRRLEVFRGIWQDTVTRCNGRIFNTAGDSILAEFASAVEAVRCAIEFQSQAASQNDMLVAHRQMHFRVGITIGDVVERGSDLLGDGVNVAARLQTLAGAGGICVSSWVREAVANKLGVKFVDLGDQTVKNIPAPIRAFKVGGRGDAAAPLVIGNGSAAQGTVIQAPAMQAQVMQDWLGRAVSSWRAMAAVLGVAAVGIAGAVYLVSQFRSPPTVTTVATPGKSGIGDVLREIESGQPKAKPAEPAAQPASAKPAVTKTAVEAPKVPAAAPQTAAPPTAPTPTAAPPQKTAVVVPPPAPANAAPAQAAPPNPAVRLGRLTESVEAELKPGARFKECDTCPEMVVIPRGDFTMGSSSTQPGHEPDEAPTRKVTVGTRLAFARYAVTVDEFDTFVTVTGYRPGAGCRVFEGGGWRENSQLSFRNPGFQQAGQHPVVCVNWSDAKAYTDWMTARMSSVYRLPTEAEREYAARAGTTTLFWWGNDIAPDKAAYDWSEAFGAGPRAPTRRGTHPVAAFPPNPWGLVQVHGNVSEWVEDCWSDNYRGAPNDASARVAAGPASGSLDCKLRVLRGGSWGYSPKDLRAAYRENATPAFRNFNFGFRVVRVLRDAK